MRKKDKAVVILTLLSCLTLILILAGMHLQRIAEKKEGEKTSETYETESSTEETETDKAQQDESVSEILENVGNEDFTDTLFIGDSRTIGLMEYGNLEDATFFADKGMSVFRLEKKQVYIQDLGKITFDELLEKKKFKKIYLMLGMNELGYSFEKVEKKYQEVLNNIIQKQEGADIYLCANLHVTAEQSQKDEIYNNENINRVNEMISSLADNETIFYIDANELFDDENGCLSLEYASDNFHVWGKYYADWVEWLRAKSSVSLGF